MRVLLDGVFNHAGRDFPPVKQALGRGPRVGGCRMGDPVRHGRQDHRRVLRGSRPARHPQPRIAPGAAVRRRRDAALAGPGIDGWRLDAAYAVPARFWAAVLPRVRERFGDAWFVGEMIHGDYAGYVAEAGLDSVTQYELWKAVWSSLDEVNLWELDWTLGRHGTCSPTSCR